MMDSFRWLFSSENFMPHGHCFFWQPGTLWLNVGSDALIAAAYFAIPLTIYFFMRQRKAEIRYSWVPTMFAAFIFLCGATHVMEIWTVWNPVYRIAGALKLVTGAVSVATSLSLLWILPRVMLLKTPLQLEAEVRARTQDLIDGNEQLRAQIAARDKAEEQLRVAEQDQAQATALLQTIVESAPALIYAKDRKGRILLANPLALKLIGKSWSEVKGRADQEFLDDRAQGEAITGNDLRLMTANHTEELEEVVGVEDGEERVWFSRKAPLRDAQGAVTGLVGVSVEITELKRLEHRLRLMVDELNHRVKNTLATVQAIAIQTMRGANRDLYEAFQGRLQALATAHDVITSEKWSGADLFEVAASQLSPVVGPIGTRVQVSGPHVRLSAKASLALAIGLHELVVNAIKYGALSNDSGQVLIHWEVFDKADPPLLRLTWTEKGGPAIHLPPRTGFGIRLIEQILPRELGGKSRIDFKGQEGLFYTIEMPLLPVLARAHVPPFPQVQAAIGAMT